MYRFRSAPQLALVAAVAILAYFQLSEPQTQTVPGNETEWSQALSQRIMALESRPQQLPLMAAGMPAAIEERVIELPEDGGNWHTVVVTTPDAYGQRLKQNFENTPQLLALRSQTTYYELPPNHWWVRQHLKGATFPLVLVQRPVSATDAKVIYKVSGPDVPGDGAILAGEIAQAIEDCRPRPTPTPTPTPTPAPVNPDPIPDLRPAVVNPQPAQDEGLGLIAYALIAASGVGGAYFGLKGDA